ncbi:mevalonate kinase [Patescibacteria group bacterium]|nr:mevalonate kinase [Patescibacteria group bacterium]
MKKITVSAPGKLMLLGEHAVVYGQPCIVTAVNQRMKATVELIDEPIFQLEAPDVQISGYKKPMDQLGIGEIPKGAKFVEIAVANFLGRHPKRPKGVEGLKIYTQSEFSSQFGFGSSSASTVCIIKALSELSGVSLDQKAIFDLAYQTVLDIQGKGSGFDVAAATFGGTLYFIKGGQTIEPLQIDSLPLVVGYSGIKADSVTLMNQVSEKASKHPQVIEDIYGIIGNLVKQAKVAILNKDFLTLGELINFDQGLLVSLGVSTKKLADMIYSAREAGAYGAKLSGAGGGDCIISIAPEDKMEAVKNRITSAGGQVIDIETNTDGVRIET